MKSTPDQATQSIWEKYLLVKNTGTDDEIKYRNLLIEKYLYTLDFTASRMNRTFPPSITFDDCYQAGYFGLLNAVQAFDPSRNVSFMRYASIRIRGCILDYIRAIDPLSRQTRSKQTEYRKAAAEIEIELGRPPTDDEIVEKLGITYKEFSLISHKIANSSSLSLHEINDKESEVGLIDMISNYKADMPSVQMDKEEFFTELLKSFTHKEIFVLTLYYREMLSLKEIGAVLDLSESRVSQIKSDVMKKLRKLIDSMYQASL